MCIRDSSYSMANVLLRAFLWAILLHGLTAFQNIILPNIVEESGLEVNKNDVQQHQEPKNCWVFSHLQKSGGSSIKTILKRGCTSCAKFIYDSPQWCGGRAVLDRFIDRQPNRNTVIMGGYTEALRLDPIFNHCTWFTMFRHPIPRLVSAFFYCKKMPGDRCCGTKKMPTEAHHDITSFAKHWGNFAVRQLALGFIPADDVVDYIQATKGPEFHCRQDSGWYWLKLYFEGNRTYPTSIYHEEGAMYVMLQRIKELLSKRFTAIGILEEFNTTISLFETALVIPGLDWHMEFSDIGARNVDKMYKDQEKKLLAESWTNSELKSYINIDLELYQHAVDVFRQQTQFHGVD